jgi:tetratricopeptide (TPR) repeat protein
MILMKNVIKFLTLGMMLATFIAISATSIFAQDMTCDAMYEKFKTIYKGSIEDRKAALELAKKYLADEKCKPTPETEDIVKFLQGQVTKLPGVIEDLTNAALYKRFNDAVPASNWDETFASGKDIITKFPDKSLDIAIVLSSIGFDRAASNPAVDKYNTDTLNYAKWVIQKIGDGVPSGTGKYGAFGTYEYTTTAFPDGKNNTLGWMNYTIGYITYERMKNQKDAIPYLYKATQINSATKAFPGIYKQIGEWYLSEFNRIGKDRADKVTANGDKDNDETLALWALQKGYLDRALDAYARAIKLASSDTTAAGKTYKDNLYNRFKTLYGIRYEDKLDNLDKSIAEMPAKPFPDPSTAVTPVVEAAPATGTGTGTVGSKGAIAESSTANTTTTVKTATTGTTTPAKTTPAKTVPKTTPKKPTPKKKV